MYKQLKTPNLDPIVYDNVTGKIKDDWYGYCLGVAQTMFGSQRTSPTAWSEWLNVVKYKHPDRNLPAGVYVPIWFSSSSGKGHVAIYKDGKVWSSPYTHKPYADVFNSIAEVERVYKSTYVGWSEDIGNTRVVEYNGNEGGSTMLTIKSMYQRLLGREADPEGIKHYTNMVATKGWEFVYNDLKNSTEGQKDWDWRNPDRVRGLESTIAAKDAEIAKLKGEKPNEEVIVKNWVLQLLDKSFKK